MPEQNDRAARRKPRQRRSERTYSHILETAAVLLGEVGFENLTTNLICERAGVTPPALYRYFANKYAILEALGCRLMEIQDAALLNWLSDFDPSDSENQIAGMLRRQIEVTRASPGALWTMRSLRSSPPMNEIRKASHRKMASEIVAGFRSAGLAAQSADIEPSVRVAVETGYAMIELAIEGDGIVEDQLIADAAIMLAALFAGRLTVPS